MSKRDAKKFVDLVEKDKSLQKKSAARFSSLQKVAKKHGLEFSRADLHNHLRQRWGISKPPEVDDVDTCTLTL